MSKFNFANRHIGNNTTTQSEMLQTLNVSTLDELISQVIPANILTNKELAITEALSEYEYLMKVRAIAQKNILASNFIGRGYYGTITPSPILRNIFENPGWYTAYTPYQAEISQGRMEALLNYQTMVMDLTGMELANASLLDEATAAAEAMTMSYNLRSRDAVKNNVQKFFIAKTVYEQTIDVVKTRALPLGIELVIDDLANFNASDGYFGILLQYPDTNGAVIDYSEITKKAKENNVFVTVATDLLSLTLLTPPGEWGADIVVGNSQRFGVPMGYGGPHAAFFATKKDYQRNIPGRIIGVSVDAKGKPALRMALQTREQHIRRDKATSNICTAQALLAIMASMYAVYHGAEGVKEIALQVHRKAALFAQKIKEAGFSVTSQPFFDTVKITFNNAADVDAIKKQATSADINLFYYQQEPAIGVSFDETITIEQLNRLLSLFGINGQVTKEEVNNTPTQLLEFRKSDYLTHPVFNSHRSESQLMRYIKKLESKDIALNYSMISLGSCTMKLNAASELMPLSWPEFNAIHPFAPSSQTEGYKEIITELEKDLAEITGFDAVSLQPNSGAQGEYAGLMAIRAYHHSRGDYNRTISLIPASAHGTNPASAALAGMQIVVVKCDELGNIDVADLKAKAEQYKENLSCLMVTYPSTHGVYEESIIDITNIIHENGGQVYMDGANMNAQVAFTSPAHIGADVCHLNLHKTFAIPHGGGGPGVGPIGVKSHLAPFLPAHTMVQTGGNAQTSAVSAAPWGSALITIISYGYIKMLGAAGLKQATANAILNANYMKNRLNQYYPILYTGMNDRVAHEFILDCREFKKSGIEVADIAKRLMDYGFHAPTVSFPVAGTLMIEPTESEDKAELDRFCDALISIRQEIREVENGSADAKNNVLKNAPHALEIIVTDKWENPYSREKAAFPLPYIRESKYWTYVSRVDDAYGDRNLVCSCLPMEAYADSEVILA